MMDVFLYKWEWGLYRPSDEDDGTLEVDLPRYILAILDPRKIIPFKSRLRAPPELKGSCSLLEIHANGETPNPKDYGAFC